MTQEEIPCVYEVYCTVFPKGHIYTVYFKYVLVCLVHARYMIPRELSTVRGIGQHSWATITQVTTTLEISRCSKTSQEIKLPGPRQSTGSCNADFSP
jgi:hypothetical protein